MTSTFYPVDDVLLNRYEVDPEALGELECSSLLEEMEQMLYGEAGCLKSYGTHYTKQTKEI